MVSSKQLNVMRFIKFCRYLFLIIGIFFLFLAYSQHSLLNGEDAVDIKTTGVVISKLKARTRQQSKRSDKVGIIYIIKPSRSLVPIEAEKRKRIFSKRLRGGKLNIKEFEKYAKPIAKSHNVQLENLFFVRRNISSVESRRIKKNDEITLFYRSDRPWRIYLNPDLERSMIPLHLIGCVIFILLSLVGFRKHLFRS